MGQQCFSQINEDGCLSSFGRVFPCVSHLEKLLRDLLQRSAIATYVVGIPAEHIHSFFEYGTDLLTSALTTHLPL
jgi:hypothetical protein